MQLIEANTGVIDELFNKFNTKQTAEFIVLLSHKIGLCPFILFFYLLINLVFTALFFQLSAPPLFFSHYHLTQSHATANLRTYEY